MPTDFEFGSPPLPPSSGSINLNSVILTTDIKRNEYEGGLKIWESAMDLARYLVCDLFNGNERFVEWICQRMGMNSGTDSDSDHHSNDDNVFSVCELGCGHALPSIAFVKQLLLQLQQSHSHSHSHPSLHLLLQDLNRPL